MKYITSVGSGHGGDAYLIHVPANRRETLGRKVGAFLSEQIRMEAHSRGENVFKRLLCSGCFSAVLANAMIWLAEDNKYDARQVAGVLGQALLDYAEYGATGADIRAKKAEDTTQARARAREAAQADIPGFGIVVPEEVLAVLAGPQGRLEAIAEDADRVKERYAHAREQGWTVAEAVDYAYGARHDGGH